MAIERGKASSMARRGWKRTETPLSHFRFYSFSGNGTGIGKKTELKTDGDIRKYENRQIRMERRKIKLEWHDQIYSSIHEQSDKIIYTYGVIGPIFTNTSCVNMHNWWLVCLWIYQFPDISHVRVNSRWK
jgi:hypothetical protein